MRYINGRLVIGLVALLTVVGLALVSIWGFVTLATMLFADARHHRQVGIHYAGPTWESNSGSNVVATRLGGVLLLPRAGLICLRNHSGQHINRKQRFK